MYMVQVDVLAGPVWVDIFKLLTKSASTNELWVVCRPSLGEHQQTSFFCLQQLQMLCRSVKLTEVD